MATIDSWFGSEEEPLLGFFDLPASGRARAAVVICPPVGHEHAIAYRALRYLGQELGERGIAAFRFDYRGQGDSAGASASADAVAGWTASIAAAVATVRAAGIEHVVLAGLTSGALLAGRALADVPGLDGVVFWDPVLSGSRYLRRQKSIHRMTVGDDDDAVEGLVPLLSLTLHDEAARALQALDLSAAALEAAAVPALAIVRRVDADKADLARLAAASTGVTVVAVDGQEELLDVASSIAVIPPSTVATIVDWVDALVPATAVEVCPTVRLEARVATAADGTPIVERLGRFGPHRLFTIETVRADAVPESERATVVLQPAAAEHRPGPGRFQVGLARDLAERGYRAVRYDRRISGETTPVVADEPNMVLAREWVDDAEALGRYYRATGPLGLVGICSGAWLAARVAPVVDARLAVAIDINYYRTNPLRPGQYAARARMDQHGEPKLGPVRHGIREILPDWLWRAVAFTQVFNNPSIMFAPLARGARTVTALLLAPEDVEVFRKNRGTAYAAELRARGGDLRVVEYERGDHALFGERFRGEVAHDVIALVESTLPAAVIDRARS